jgi:hypothetical protein
MVEVDTFLTTLYVMVDDFCRAHPPKHSRPGPDASLSSSEVVTLAIFSRWSRFSSERDFYPRIISSGLSATKRRSSIPLNATVTDPGPSA